MKPALYDQRKKIETVLEDLIFGDNIPPTKIMKELIHIMEVMREKALDTDNAKSIALSKVFNIPVRKELYTYEELWNLGAAFSHVFPRPDGSYSTLQKENYEHFIKSLKELKEEDRDTIRMKYGF